MDAGILQQIRHFQPREMTAYVSSQENRGYQTLCIMEHEDAKTYYFSTRRSARRTWQYQTDPYVSLFLADSIHARGMELKGRMRVRVDDRTKQRLWRDSLQVFFPGGVDDPEFCVLSFTAEKGEYLWDEQRVAFTMDELERAN